MNDDFPADGPIIVGGNGHSGTRVFIEIVSLGGVFTGVDYLTKRHDSEDLRVFDLLNRWVAPYVFGTLDDIGAKRMRVEFARRLRLYFPLRLRPWGFKNPRTMLILPLLNELLPTAKFVHVIRDGRDISLGNPFASSNKYVDAYLTDGERNLPADEKMILFWGRSNQQAMEYGSANMSGRYLRMRWEDMCRSPLAESERLLRFAKCDPARAESAAKKVNQPKSMGRWKTYPDETRERVNGRGAPWLKLFGYT